MSNLGGLCFSRDQIKAILTEFIQFFQTEECAFNLAKLATNETAMTQYIDKRQQQIFEKHGIYPSSGFKDLGQVTTVYRSDHELMSLISQSVTLEETVLDKALGGSAFIGVQNEEEFRKKLEKMGFFEMQAKLKNPDFAKDPQQVQQFQMQMQQFVSTLSQEERIMLQKVMMEGMSPEQIDQLRQQQMRMMQHQHMQHDSHSHSHGHGHDHDHHDHSHSHGHVNNNNAQPSSLPPSMPAKPPVMRLEKD